MRAAEPPRHDLDPDVLTRLRDAYTYFFGPGWQVAMFFWLWDSLKDSCSELSCHARERYVGFYRGRHIVAYLDFQKYAIKIGFFSDFADRLKLRDGLRQPFPAWNGSRELVGMCLSSNKDREILKALEHCYRWT